MVPLARDFLKDKQHIKSKKLGQHLGISTQRAGRLMTYLFDWKKANNNASWERVDTNLTPNALSIRLSIEHHSFLQDRKQKTGISFNAQIRQMIDSSIHSFIQ